MPAEHDPKTYGLEPLELPVPPDFAQLLGYQGDRRYLAAWWSPVGDELVFSDGVVSADGEWQTWLLWARHETVRKVLRPFDFGGSDHQAQDALLLDRLSGTFHAGPKRLVLLFVQSAPDLIAEREAFANLTDEKQKEREREALAAAERESERINRFLEDEEALQAYVQKRMRKQEEQLGQLMAWLEGQGGRSAH